MMHNSSFESPKPYPFVLFALSSVAPTYSELICFISATELSRTLAKAYKDKSVFDYSVLEGEARAFSWILYVDILILEVGGNLYDAVSIAVKAALHSTTIPRVKIATIDGGQPELEITDDPLDGYRLNVENSPILVTMCRIGNDTQISA